MVRIILGNIMGYDLLIILLAVVNAVVVYPWTKQYSILLKNQHRDTAKLAVSFRCRNRCGMECWIVEAERYKVLYSMNGHRGLPGYPSKPVKG